MGMFGGERHGRPRVVAIRGSIGVVSDGGGGRRRVRIVTVLRLVLVLGLFLFTGRGVIQAIGTAPMCHQGIGRLHVQSGTIGLGDGSRGPNGGWAHLMLDVGHRLQRRTVPVDPGRSVGGLGDGR